MYCACHRPKIVVNNALGESFEVCSEKLGGCGQEVRTSPPEIPKKHKEELVFEMFEECPTCKGTGEVTQFYSIGPVDEECERCYGTGVI